MQLPQYQVDDREASGQINHIDPLVPAKMQYKHVDSFTGLCCICSNPVGPLPDTKQDMIGFDDSLRK